MNESEIVELLKRHGIDVVIGARHSIRCQFGQIANAIREVEENNKLIAKDPSTLPPIDQYRRSSGQATGKTDGRMQWPCHYDSVFGRNRKR